MRKYLISLTLLFSLIAHSQAVKYSVARIKLRDSHSISELIEAGVSADHGMIKPGVYVESVFSEREISEARKRGYQVEIIHPDAIAYYENTVKNRPAMRNSGPCDSDSDDYTVPSHFNLGSMGGFLTYQQLLDELDEMHASYPDLISEKTPIENFQTTGGRPIYYCKLSDNVQTDEDEPEILYTAVHHAREPESMQQLVFFMWYLLENYNTDPEIQDLVDHTEFYFIPMVNPDGYVYNETTNPDGGGMWRKNRRDNGDGSMGVDLNRNYSYHWNESGTSDSWGETYAGPAPFSEPETQAVKWMVNHHNFIMAINNHTYSRLLLFPFGYAENTPTPDNDLFEDFTAYMVSHNGYTNEISSALYPAAGDSDDWMYGDTSEHDKIFSMTPEIGYSFWPSQSDIIPICKEMMFLNITAAHLIHNYAVITDDTGHYWSQSPGTFNYQIKRMGLTGNGTFNVNVQAVSDNISFNNSSETFNLSYGESQPGSYDYTLDSGIQNGDIIAFKVLVDNGTDTTEYNFTKIYGEMESIFTDTADDMSNWNSSQWGITTSDYYSAPSCITDSPSGYYSSNESGTLVLSQNIDLSDADDAYVSFYAKWAIEPGWDYVQFEVSTDGGNTWAPQCGQYTHPGANTQGAAEGEPLYDGVQNTWVMEEIPLTDYLGENILFRFHLVSDGYEEMDGFYVDDMEVKTSPSIGISESGLNPVHIYPNPAHHRLYFSGIDTLTPVIISDLQGRTVMRATCDTGDTLDIENLKSGVYIAQVIHDGRRQVWKFIKE